MLLLLLGITSLVATLPEIKEGLMTFLILIQQLQNIHKHRPLHRACMDQHKSNSTLNEVRMEWGRELHLGNVSFLAEMVWAKGQSERGTTNDGRC